MNILLVSFIGTIILFTIVGVISISRSKGTSHDYLIASRSIPPWQAGLSAIATNNSGFMFIGMIGYTYVAGLSSIWLMIGWIIGDLFGSLLVHRPIRVISQRRNAHSINSLIAHFYGEERILLRRVLGTVAIIFLTIYAAAQLVAGSKALEVTLSWDSEWGVIISATVILIYSFAGGLRASIWTDIVQSFVMLFAMGALLWIGVTNIGGINLFIENLYTINYGYMYLFPVELNSDILSIVGFIIGWFFGGVGVIGQPHILIRYIALDNSKSLNKMRLYYYSWFTIFYALTIAVGLVARLLIPDTSNFDAETALLLLSAEILPPFFVGVVLAGLFAATISTADSLILSCSATLTRDFTSKPLNSFGVAKLGTLTITLIAVFIALSNNKTIFNLVLDAWGVLASSFGPLIILHIFSKKFSQTMAIYLFFVGAILFYVWNIFGSENFYAIAQAWISVLLIYFILQIMRPHNENKSMENNSSSSLFNKDFFSKF